MCARDIALDLPPTSCLCPRALLWAPQNSRARASIACLRRSSHLCCFSRMVLAMARSLEEWPGLATARRQPCCVVLVRGLFRQGVACPVRWMCSGVGATLNTRRLWKRRLVYSVLSHVSARAKRKSLGDYGLVRSSIVSRPVTPMMHVFSRHVFSNQDCFSIRLCQPTTFHESRFSWNYAPDSGVRTEHLSAHPSYARSPNHVSFSCWQITVHKPESQRMRASKR